MSWSYPLGRLFGSQIRVHATFFLLLLWVALSAWASGGPAAALGNTVFILALFACVVAHEFGHALMARRYGIRTPVITLLPIGGVAQLEKMPEVPLHEVLVALAGPLVNVVIWAVITLIWGLSPGLAEIESLDAAASDFAAQLAGLNLFLAVFNLIPAFPMDGGRVLRALLAIPMERARATRVAAATGQAVAVAFALIGLLSGNLILVLIAFFVFAAGTAEAAHVEMEGTVEGLAARDAMITAYEALTPEDGLMAMSSGLLRSTQHEFPVLDGAGRLQGFVTRDAIFHAAAAEHPTAAAEVMQTGIPQVDLRAPLKQALDALAQGDVPAVAVAGPEGAFLGYITRENIGELVVLRQARRKG